MIRMAQGKYLERDIVLTRFTLPSSFELDRSKPLVSPIKVSSSTPIECTDSPLHCDFANRFPGGGALDGGCVQEEILFVIKPECLLSMLTVAMLEDRDAFLIEGAEKFCSYSGYARRWAFAGDFREEAGVENVIVGIDATVNRHGQEAQFEDKNFFRDIYKCIAGLQLHAGKEFATGNWGGGAFGGCKHLKAFQQLIACSAVGCPVMYCTFGEKPLEEEIERFRDAYAGATIHEMLEVFFELRKDYIAKNTLLNRMVEVRK